MHLKSYRVLLSSRPVSLALDNMSIIKRPVDAAVDTQSARDCIFSLLLLIEILRNNVQRKAGEMERNNFSLLVTI